MAQTDEEKAAADAAKAAGQQNRSSNGLSYFKSRAIPGLSVVVGKVPKGQVAHESVRFTPYVIKPEVGDEVTIGFLKTDNQRAIEILREDVNVAEIDKDEFEKYTKVDGVTIRKARQ